MSESDMVGGYVEDFEKIRGCFTCGTVQQFTLDENTGKLVCLCCDSDTIMYAVDAFLTIREMVQAGSIKVIHDEEDNDD